MPPLIRGMSAPIAHTPSTDPESQLRDLLDRIAEVCPVPATAQKVMALAGDPDSDMEVVVNAVASDPALTAEVLRVANSPIYGFGGRIADLRQAVVMLGFGELRNVAAAMAMLSAFGGEGEMWTRLHNQCVLSGSLGGLIATKLRRHRGEAWLAATLSDIGALACLAVDGDRYRELYQLSGLDFGLRQEQEEALYGAGTDELGARLLERNELPQVIAGAVRGQLDGATELTRLTWLARRLAPVVVACGEQGDLEALDAVLPQLVEVSGLSLDVDATRELCLSAGDITQRGLSGQASLVPKDPDAAAESSVEFQGADEVAVEDAPGRKKQFKKRSWRLW